MKPNMTPSEPILTAPAFDLQIFSQEFIDRVKWKSNLVGAKIKLSEMDNVVPCAFQNMKHETIFLTSVLYECKD
jgi:hypothetical protein